MVYKAKPTGNTELDKLVARWNESGRLAYVHPRKQRVCINGQPGKTYRDAAAYLRANLSRLGEI